MRRRCYDPAFIVYRYYGARGVTVCDEWRTDFEMFQKWAFESGWRRGLTLDRIDCQRGYEPSNCRWVTRAEQSCNRLSWNIPVTIGGVTDLAGHWADKYGIRRAIVYHRIKNKHWDPVRAVTTPVAKQSVTRVTLDGETHSLFEWAKLLGVNRTRIYNQVKAGRKAAAVIRELKEKQNGVQD